MASLTPQNHQRNQMDTSVRAGEPARPAIQHPDARVPADLLHEAYVGVLSAIARHEPDALERVVRAISDEGSNLPGERARGTAALLAREWLVFAGNHARAVVEPPEQVFLFTFPATMTFEMVGSGTPESARRRALRAVRALVAEDEPLGAISGPHPAHPAMLNLTVWAGSSEGDAEDRLRLELAGGDDDARQEG